MVLLVREKAQFVRILKPILSGPLVLLNWRAVKA